MIWLVAAAISFAMLCGIALWRNRASATGDPHASAPAPDVELLVREGRVIDAIKLYREQTGVSLAEAKQAVDRLRTAK